MNMLGITGPKSGEIPVLKKKVHTFLADNGMFYGEIDIRKYAGYFIEEMEKGLNGEKSSLRMLPTFIEFEDREQINLKEPVIVLDAGGTNLRSALVKFNKNGFPRIYNISKSLMPGVISSTSKEDFFRALACSLQTIIDKSSKIGFVFSYAMEISPDRDGRLLYFTKEIKAPEVVGEYLGRNLINAISGEGFDAKKKVTLLNDTVASLLAGIIAFPQRTYESYIGLVLGTGTNTSYLEKNAEIKKIINENSGMNMAKAQIVNIESGNFSRGPNGIIDKLFDSHTLNPGKYTFEKMFSGAYLGGLALEVLKAAAEIDLFSEKTNNIFKSLNELKSMDIDAFLNFPPVNSTLNFYFSSFTPGDNILIYFLFDALIERAAVLAAIVIAAIILKTNKGRNPCFPVCVVAEGSSFYRMKDFHSRLRYYLSKLLYGKKEHFYEINKVENAVLLGGAAAGLMS